LASLFRAADTVALARVVAGDTENYSIPIYRAKVVKSFKGAASGEIIYFGPYEGTRLGSEYILFLRNMAQPLAPKAPSNVGFGTVRYSEVFNEGFGSMETSYSCVFKGKTVSEQCDDGVSICTRFVILPKSYLRFLLQRKTLPSVVDGLRKKLSFRYSGHSKGQSSRRILAARNRSFGLVETGRILISPIIVMWNLPGSHLPRIPGVGACNTPSGD
jgi:hypothetical protein